MNKHLVYFTIGGDERYSCLLKRCIESMNDSMKNEEKTFDILIICDDGYFPIIKDLNTLTWVTDKNKDGVEASMKKTQIFSWPYIQNYEKVLYIDSDMLVLENLNRMFENALDDETLYVFPERGNKTPYDNLYYSLLIYKQEEKEFLRNNNIPGFNCGQFMFVPSASMQLHFENVVALTKTHKGQFFYEQSFMNHYFNINGKLDYGLMESFVQLCPQQYEKEQGKTLYHFAGCGTPYKKKLDMMNQYYTQVMHKRSLA